MKFAKELEQELVPEWKALYVDYKGGKKKIKELVLTIRKANATPKTPGRRPHDISASPVVRRTPLPQVNTARDNISPLHQDAAFEDQFRNGRSPEPERESLRNSPEGNRHRYGSISTPSVRAAPSLVLPGPALDPIQKSVSRNEAPSAFEVGKTASPQPKNPFGRRLLRRQTMNDGGESPRNILQRWASGTWSRASPWSDAELQTVDPITARERDFFRWMDSELKKVDNFYKEMEDKNEERLKVLREQLHEFHIRRMQELADVRGEESSAPDTANDPNKSGQENGNDHPAFSSERLGGWLGPLGKALGPHPGSNSRALQRLVNSPGTYAREAEARSAEGNSRYMESGRDYVQRRPVEIDGPNYRSAKHKLKLALQEYYRGLELLKSYALLNRTAFRKINKKYDKAVGAQKPLRYFSEKVNKAHFVQSEKTDTHIVDVEDLYSRYFAGGKRKVAVGKLRTSSAKRPDYYLFGISNGLMVGIAAVFAVQGLVFAIQLLLNNNTDSTIRGETSYLLQLYGGYFLCLYLFSWFCFDCVVWTKYKINYPFIFEFDPRNRLDWQELMNFPSFFSLLLGLFLWVNFSGYGSQEMFIWYPVILICLTGAIIFFPFQILVYRSRRWFIYSHWRLLCAGAYQVEFRDFFLGDMYGSLTYAMSNIELFFCLYIPTDHWLNPGQCNSSSNTYKGRLLGLCSALPAIWRALQCIRRYFDSGDMYPHLANCGKYIMTILYYTTLSLFRMNNHPATKTAFIFMAALNAIYVTFWDLVNDWSLCQPDASARFLRNTRGFKRTWWYYLAMIIDPILRFNWIFYAIYTHSAGHASLVSFLIAFSECTRRGMWTLFRVENEHCTNVGHYRAVRDVSLPYKIEDASTLSVDDNVQEEGEAQVAEDAGLNEDGNLQQSTPESPGLSRRRSTLRRVVTFDGSSSSGRAPVQQGSLSPHLGKKSTTNLAQMFAEGHAKDFVKKRPADGPVDLEANYGNRRYEDSDDESDTGESRDSHTT